MSGYLDWVARVDFSVEVMFKPRPQDRSVKR